MKGGVVAADLIQFCYVLKYHVCKTTLTGKTAVTEMTTILTDVVIEAE